MRNPLIQLGFEIPFDQIKAAHVEPAVDALLASAQAAVDAIAESGEPRTYANTLGALEEGHPRDEQLHTRDRHCASECRKVGKHGDRPLWIDRAFYCSDRSALGLADREATLNRSHRGRQSSYTPPWTLALVSSPSGGGPPTHPAQMENSIMPRRAESFRFSP